MKDTITLPLIHLGGSNGGDLAETYNIACLAVLNLKRFAAEACPHGRDYPGGNYDYAKARAEHNARLEKINELENEFRALAEHCQYWHDQKEERMKGRTSPKK